MRIRSIELRRVQIPMKRAFKHALQERRHTDAVLVAITDEDGRVGWGEILPRPYVTGESIATVLEAHAPALAARLIDAELGAITDVVGWLRRAADEGGRALATLCGFDLALLDLGSQAFGVPVTDVLGGVVRDELPAGVIIGFETPTDKLARYCAALRLAGKTHVKVKVGLEDDLARLAIVAKVWKQVPLRLDANAAWTVDESIAKLDAFKAEIPIASIEQPIAADDLAGLRRIREITGIRVMADESVCSLADAERLVAERAADIFNVRIGKNGGLVAGLRLVEYANAHGIEVHLGTMVGETGVLGRASELFGRCVPGFECLDGKGQNAFLLEVDIATERSDIPAGSSAALGLGFEVMSARLQDHQVGETLHFGHVKETA